MFRRFLCVLLSGLLVMAMTVTDAAAQSAKVRIKDLVEFDGVRGNDLLGYGLVVGLNGTGDGIRNSPFTELSLADAMDLPVEISFWVLLNPALMVFSVCSATRLLAFVRMLDIFDPLDERQLLLPDYMRPPVFTAVPSF
ncbi:MAG: hypothetical protein GXP03_03140 [Alphaproteobacteria bacterium]|nr:hypothetical protein [Alphaproteobacteria bacterium]